MLRSSYFVLVLLLAMTIPVQAETGQVAETVKAEVEKAGMSLIEKRQVKKWAEQFDHYEKRAEEVCGTNFDVEIDAQSWKSAPKEHQGWAFGSYCGNGCLFGIEMVCKDDDGKAAVAEKINNVVCRYHADDEVKLTLSNGTLECNFSTRDMQFQAQTIEKLTPLL